MGQEKPKLVVGIVVDQMRYEYLHRFESKFGEEGFKRLMNKGYNFKNAHFNYIPTKTAPGHASIYTGSTPAVHGIIGNEWYDKVSEEVIYCTTDSEFKTIGSTSTRGQSSPKYLIPTTLTDEFRLANQMQSRVVSISVKDRGAIFPGGHTANAAYWYDIETGKFISSSYYMENLPKWATEFNNKKQSDGYLKSVWDTKLPIEQYVESRIDDFKTEGKIADESSPIFPHDFSKMTLDNTKKYNSLKYSPFANTLTTDFVVSALNNEKLGAGEFSDFLAISYSASDYVGHKFGPNSIEVEDIYLRLDDELARLLKELDNKIGNGNYLVFLTADHAVLEIPEFLSSKNIPSGLTNSTILSEKLNKHLTDTFGEGEWITKCKNLQLYFNWNTINSSNVSEEKIINTTIRFLIAQKEIANAYSSKQMLDGDYNEGGLKGSLIRGFNQERSGDILFSLHPGWYDNLWDDAADHGSGYSYDTHVPLLFYGWNIKQGSSVEYHPITDIAPTISTLLNIKLPSGCTGQPIKELFE